MLTAQKVYYDKGANCYNKYEHVYIYYYVLYQKYFKLAGHGLRIVSLVQNGSNTGLTWTKLILINENKVP